MEVVLQDHPDVEPQTLLPLTEGEGADEDVAAGWRLENRESVDDCGGDEVRPLRILDGVATAPLLGNWQTGNGVSMRRRSSPKR